MNIFEEASKLKLRYPSVRGSISTEDLWTLPLEHSAGMSLLNIAGKLDDMLAVSSRRRTLGTEETNKVPKLQLSIVEHIIDIKIKAKEVTAAAKAKADELSALLEALEAAKGTALTKLSPEEIQARIDALK